VAPTVRSFSADLEPLTLIERFPAAYPGLLESGAGQAAAGSGSRFDILPFASGEVLRLGTDMRLSGPFASSSGFLAALAVVGTITGGLWLARPMLLAMGAGSLVLFFVMIVAVCVFFGVPIAVTF